MEKKNPFKILLMNSWINELFESVVNILKIDQSETTIVYLVDGKLHVCDVEIYS